MNANLKSIRRILSLCALSLAVCATPALADGLQNVLQAKKVRIGVSLDLPPYGMMSTDMKPTGLDVEVAQDIAKDLGVELELVHTVGAARVPNLQTNKVDLVVATLSITPDRAKVIDFSVPYMPIQTIVAGKKGIEVKGLQDLVGKTVKTSRGTAMDNQLTREAKGANIVRYEDDATLIAASVNGQADLIGTTSQVLFVINDKLGGQAFEPKFVLTNLAAAVGMRKGETQLKARVDDWVRRSLKNGRLNALYQKYFHQDLPAEILAGANAG